MPSVVNYGFDAVTYKNIGDLNHYGSALDRSTLCVFKNNSDSEGVGTQRSFSADAEFELKGRR